MITEQEKHWNKIKYYAQKWRESEIEGGKVKMHIINLKAEISKLENDLEQIDKKVKLYSHKTRSNILVEVI